MEYIFNNQLKTYTVITDREIVTYRGEKASKLYKEEREKYDEEVEKQEKVLQHG